jgi:hypothetical protein
MQGGATRRRGTRAESIESVERKTKKGVSGGCNACEADVESANFALTAFSEVQVVANSLFGVED